MTSFHVKPEKNLLNFSGFVYRDLITGIRVKFRPAKSTTFKLSLSDEIEEFIGGMVVSLNPIITFKHP